MTVTAKFVVSVRTQRYNEEGPVEVVLTPNYGTAENPKNAEWAKATPSGKIEMTIDNPAASEQFELGREFTVTFE
jgi:hypothetical protein